jgi:MoxR-like ATPase
MTHWDGIGGTLRKDAWVHEVVSIDAVEAGLASVGYIPSRQIATAVYLAHHLQKPILVEGPAGVGKTELAKSVASWLGLKLIRMQCYEGLDESKALYEWKYGKQLLYTRRSASCEALVTSSSRPSSWNPARCCARCRTRTGRCC